MEMHQTQTIVKESRPAQSRDLLVEVLSGPLDGLEFRLDQPVITIGRAEGNDICLSLDLLVSRSHARLRRVEEELWLEDVNSLNGTYLEEKRLTEKTKVASGTIIRVGMTEFRITYGSEAK